MDFELPVNYKGSNLIFPSHLYLYGYTQKIEVLVNGIKVMYERDDERDWRATVDPAEVEKTKLINVELLRAIAHAIEEVLK